MLFPGVLSYVHFSVIKCDAWLWHCVLDLLVHDVQMVFLSIHFRARCCVWLNEHGRIICAFVVNDLSIALVSNSVFSARNRVLNVCNIFVSTAVVEFSTAAARRLCLGCYFFVHESHGPQQWRFKHMRKTRSSETTTSNSAWRVS